MKGFLILTYFYGKSWRNTSLSDKNWRVLSVLSGLGMARTPQFFRWMDCFLFMGHTWSTWSEPLMYFTCVPDNSSWGVDDWMAVKTRIERAPRPLYVWVKHLNLAEFKELLPNLAQVWTLHPEKSNATTGRRKTGSCLIPPPSLISCIVVLTSQIPYHLKIHFLNWF